MAHLVLESGEGQGKRFPLGRVTVLGRLKSCDIPLKDHKASRNNTKIEGEPGLYFVEDLGSSNGTFLNGSKISKEKLAHGDRIKIGKTVFLFEDPPKSQPKPKPPPPRPVAIATSPAESIAALETPPAGVAPPVPQAEEDEADDRVDELDLDGEEDVITSAPTPARAAPAPAPAAAPPAKPAYVSRVPIRPSKVGGRKPRMLLLEDISQRSGSFRAVIYLLLAGLMALLAYGAYALASSAM